MKVKDLIKDIDFENIYQEFCVEVIKLNLKDIKKSKSEESIENMKKDIVFRLKELDIDFNEEDLEW